LRLARYIEKRKLPKIPASHVLSKKTLKAFPALGMMRNDALSDCTCAAMAHSFQTWTAYGGQPWVPSDTQIVALYNKVNHGVDKGANMLDVLNKVREEGIGGNKIYAFVAIDTTDHDQVRTAHFLFGGLYFGAGLPVTAQAQEGEGKVWELLPGANGSEPYSWGGHAMNLVDTGKKTLKAVTWGHLQALTWEWWDRYVDECFAILEEDYVGADKRSPQGFSLKKLAADLVGL